MLKRIAYLLTYLIGSGGQKCPSAKFFPIDETKLYDYAKRNKCLPYLFHLANCPNCRRYLSRNFIKRISDHQTFSLFWVHVYETEKKALAKFCQKKGVKLVAIKDFSIFDKLSFHRNYLMGADYDVLLAEQDFPLVEGYLKKNGYHLRQHLTINNSRQKRSYQEKDFVQPQKKISFDLHTTIAIPHEDSFGFLPEKIIRQVSYEIYNKSTSHSGSGLYQPPLEYLLLIAIIHFSGSDLFKGLRNLFDIIHFVSLYQKKFDWDSFLKLTSRFKITTTSLFSILLGSQVFKIEPPKVIKRKGQANFRVRFLLSSCPPEKIAIFPAIEEWTKDNQKAAGIYYENFFMKLFLADFFSPLYLLRPQVILFGVRSALTSLTTILSHRYRKSF